MGSSLLLRYSGKLGLAWTPPPSPLHLCTGEQKKKGLTKWAEVLLAALHTSHQEGVLLIEPTGTIRAHFRWTGRLAAGISQEQVNGLALPVG